MSRVWAAAQAHWVRMSISQTLPLVVFPEPRFPPVMLLPGQTPAQEARCAAVGNRDMSTPISAMMVSAARFPTPVMVSSRSRARMRGTITSPVCSPSSLLSSFLVVIVVEWVAKTSSTRVSRRAIAASRCAVWSSDSPISRA